MTSAYLDPFSQIVGLARLHGKHAVLVLEIDNDASVYTVIPNGYGAGIDQDLTTIPGEVWLYEVTAIDSIGMADQFGHKYGEAVMNTRVTKNDGKWYTTTTETLGFSAATPLSAYTYALSSAAALSGETVTVTRKVKVEDYVFTHDARISQPGNLYLMGTSVEANAPRTSRHLYTLEGAREFAAIGLYEEYPSFYPRNDLLSKNFYVDYIGGVSSPTPSIYSQVWRTQKLVDQGDPGVQYRIEMADKIDSLLLLGTRIITFNAEYNGGYAYNWGGQLRGVLWDFKVPPFIPGQSLFNFQRARSLSLVTTYNWIRTPPW